mgnify:CR=1 FL=1
MRFQAQLSLLFSLVPLVPPFPLSPPSQFFSTVELHFLFGLVFVFQQACQ